MIAATLREAQVVGCDETGARLSTATLGTRMAWEWVLVSDRAVLHRICLSRGRDVIDELMAGHRPRAGAAAASLDPGSPLRSGRDDEEE